MQLIFSFLICVFSTAWTAPFLRLTPAEYKVFQTALNGGKPLFMQSALSVMTIKDVKEDRTVLLNIGGKNGHYSPKFLQRKSYFDPKLSASRPKTSFRRVRPFASINSNDNRISRRPTHSFDLPIYRHDLSNLTPISKRMQLIKRVNRRLKRDVGESQKTEDARIKRQSEDEDEDYDYDDYDYEEEPIRYAEELSFGLSTAGGILGGAVGGYLDTTGVATLKLIRSLESLGLIALSQLDGFLDTQDEERIKREEAEAAEKAAARLPYDNTIVIRK